MPAYNIRMLYPEEQQSKLEPIQGYPVSLPELEGIDLFIHRPYEKSIIGNQSWNISEAKTGLALITNCMGTKQQAIDALKSKLNNIATDDIKLYIQHWVNEYIAKYPVANQ